MGKRGNDAEKLDGPRLQYTAPALEKGLDILELLASSPTPLTASVISGRLNKSANEMFRMIHILENRRYVAMAENQDGYELTNKPLSLCLTQGISQNLIEHAMPLLRSLTEEVLHACHIVVVSNDQTVVVGHVEPAVSFHINAGFRQNIVDTAAGAILYACQQPLVRNAWKAGLQPTVPHSEWQTFEEHATKALADRYLVLKRSSAEGVTDISCPVFSDRGPVAAITILYMKGGLSASIEKCVISLVATASRLSAALGAASNAWLQTNIPSCDQ